MTHVVTHFYITNNLNLYSVQNRKKLKGIQRYKRSWIAKCVTNAKCVCKSRGQFDQY